MGLEYVQSDSFQQTADFTLDEDLWGLGNLRRTYEGRTDQLLAFLKKWPKGKSDEDLKAYKLRQRTSTGGRAYSKVVLEFTGLLDGKLPDPVQTGGWAKQSASIQQLEGEVVTEIVYNAPTTTFRYVTDKKPVAPRFPGQLLTDKTAWQIRKQRGNRTVRFHECFEVINVAGNVVFSQTKVGLFNYARVVATTDFTIEQEGSMWRCSETNAGEIIDVPRNDLARYLTPAVIAIINQR